jgi:hypothetical protein
VTEGEAARVRRRAVLLLGGLAATMLLAGLLPWLTGGELTIRLFGLPLLLAGLLVAGVTLRVATVRRPAPSAPPVERRCDGCVCGTGGGCAALSGQPAAEG